MQMSLEPTNAATLDFEKKSQMRLKINEIFYSIQGEASFAGHPCVFIRLSGCPLRCSWCDTEYAFHEGSEFSIDDVLQEIDRYPCNLVEVTGGEPLAQRNTPKLLEDLLGAGKSVLLETAGAYSIEGIPEQVHIIMDLKAPGSGMQKKNRYENLRYLKRSDDLKIVIRDRTDFEWAEQVLREFFIHDILEKPVLLQPVFDELSAVQLAEWIKNSEHSFRLGLQLHKILYPEQDRGI